MIRGSGFTLVETIMAVSLMLLLFGLGSLFSTTYVRAQHVRSAAMTVTNELSHAQTDAVAQTDDASHGIAIFTDRVVRFVGTSYATRDQAQDVETLFADSLTVSSVTELVFSAGAIGPNTAGMLTLESGILAIDLTLSAYGVLETTERTVNP